MSDEITLRDAALDDAGAICAILATAPETAQWTPAQVRESILSSRQHAVVAERGGQVIGFYVAGALANEWELENIAVAPVLRGTGLGARLLAALLVQARGAGAECVLLEVRASNQAARKLYEKQGFTVIGRRPDYYQNPRESAVMYRKQL